MKSFCERPHIDFPNNAYCLGVSGSHHEIILKVFLPSLRRALFHAHWSCNFFCCKSHDFINGGFFVLSKFVKLLIIFFNAPCTEMYLFSTFIIILDQFVVGLFVVSYYLFKYCCKFINMFEATSVYTYFSISSACLTTSLCMDELSYTSLERGF